MIKDSKVTPSPAMLQRKMSARSKSFDASSFAKLIDNNVSTFTDDSERQSLIETVRLKVKKYMAASYVGKTYENILLLLSVLSCFQYIYQTYLTGDGPFQERLVEAFSIVELFLASLFAFDWALSLFVADHKGEHFRSFFSMVDIFTVLPIYITYQIYPEPVEYNDISTVSDAFNYFLYGAYTLRILRALRVYRKLNFLEDEVQRFLGQMAVSIITMILFDSALMQYLEKHTQDMQFHTWSYYMVVTIATVGYGDIAPQSTLGRFCAMVYICFAIIYLPKKTNELIEKMNRSSIYARLHYYPRGNNKHVLICGDLRSTSLLEFFSELFHEDHESTNLNAVILQPESPSYDMQKILFDPIFSLVLHYLEGSPLVEADLSRAKANTAIAIFLMGNKFSSVPDEEDARTILQQFSIRRFIASTLNNDPLFCLQLIRPENRRHLANDDNSDNERELVVCLNEMKMGVIAKTVIFPGTSTLIFNLLSSFSDDAGVGDGNNNEDDSETGDGSGTWIHEYQKGCDWEMYTTTMNDAFEGAKFIDLACSLYQKLGVVLFALRIKELKGKGHVRVLLNPADFVIPSKTKYSVEGFVIAKNKAASDLSFSNDNSSEMRVSQLSLIATAMTKSSDTTTAAIRRESMAVGTVNPIRPKPEGAFKGWQALMSQYDHERDESNNQQEALQKIEDEYIKSNFFVRDTPMDIEDATVKSSVLEEYPNMSEHLIVIGKGLSNLYDFIRPLRAKQLGRLKHIVILHPTDIPYNVWRRISIFEGLLYVRGSPLEENDIRRAGIFRAEQVVVLADSMQHDSKNGLISMDALVDADAIFTYQCVKRLNEKAHIVIEIVRHQNVGYLDPTSNLMNTRDTDYRFTPHFAAGAIFTSSLLDSVVCQAFYNPQIIRVINKLISGADPRETNPVAAYPGLHNKRPKAGIQSIIGSSLYQIPVPDNIEDKTYGGVFNVLAKEGILPIGLLRGVFNNMNIGPKANKMSYVYTNPSSTTEIFSCDRVFVLSQKVLTASKSSIKEVMEKFRQTTAQAMARRRAGVEDATIAVEAMREDFQDVTQSQRTLERTVSALSEEFKSKLDKLVKVVSDISTDNKTGPSNGARRRFSNMDRSVSLATGDTPKRTLHKTMSTVASEPRPISRQLSRNRLGNGVEEKRRESVFSDDSSQFGSDTAKDR